MLPEISKHNREAVPQNPKPHTLLFKPRQVLLSLRRNTTAATATATETTMKNSEEQATLNSDQTSLLLNSVLCYLNNHGFDKPLKRLISAANIQDEKWKACSLDLEDMFKHYLETCSNSNANAKMDTSKDEEMLSNGTKKDGDDHSSKEAIVKKKKKKGGDTENIPAVAEDIEVKTKKKTKKASESIEESEQVSEQVKKEQKDKKKKSKHNSVPLESNIDSLEEVKPKDKKKKSEKSAKSDGDGEAVPDVEGKSKDKKKKKKQNLDSSIEKAEKPLEGETVLSKDEKKEKEESASEILSNGVTEMENKEGIKEQEKESKKRKRSDSDEKDNGTPLKNGDYQVNGGESTGNKSRKKDNNGSAEPKTVTAFQRVKIDDVKFADKRLQDNSYWAKDGADVGYGAKAQEVLGQVRGRDFRHEKTKKKRGSYRGGQIDLHSHSVKFNYDNED